MDEQRKLAEYENRGHSIRIFVRLLLLKFILTCSPFV